MTGPKNYIDRSQGFYSSGLIICLITSIAIETRPFWCAGNIPKFQILNALQLFSKSSPVLNRHLAVSDNDCFNLINILAVTGRW